MKIQDILKEAKWIGKTAGEDWLEKVVEHTTPGGKRRKVKVKSLPPEEQAKYRPKKEEGDKKEDLKGKIKEKKKELKKPKVPEVISNADNLWKKLDTDQKARFLEKASVLFDIGDNDKEKMSKMDGLDEVWSKTTDAIEIEQDPDSKGLNLTKKNLRQIFKKLVNIGNSKFDRHFDKSNVNYILTGERDNYSDPKFP